MRVALPLAFAAMVIAGTAAHAEDFRFRFFGSPLGGSPQGEVTGTIYGLSASGTSEASEIAASSSLGDNAVFFASDNPFENSFSVSDGVITSALFDDTTQPDHLGIEGLYAANFFTGPAGQVGNFSGANGVAFSAVSAAPEPSTWLLMFAGIGGIGLMLRRAKGTMGFRFKKHLHSLTPSQDVLKRAARRRTRSDPSEVARTPGTILGRFAVCRIRPSSALPRLSRRSLPRCDNLPA